MLYSVLQQNGDGGTGGICGGLIIMVLGLAVLVGLWKVYAKAGQPGCMSLIPIVNYYVLLNIIGRPGWWLLLMFIPFVNIIVFIVVYIDLAKSFGKSTGYGLGLIFLSPIFIIHLGFSEAEYVGPAAA